MAEQILIRKAQQVIPLVLQSRNLPIRIKEWAVTERDGIRILFAVLDDDRLVKEGFGLYPFKSKSVLHDMSTLLDGTQVRACNSVGMAYAVMLSAPPSLPTQVEFPGVQLGSVLIGMNSLKRAVAPSVKEVSHLIIAGETGSGKSNFMRSFVYQIITNGHRLMIADAKGLTFPMLEGHPALLAPIGHNESDYVAILTRAREEIERRRQLFKGLNQTGKYPDDLGEYNRLVNVGEQLPYVFVILEEYNNALEIAGGTNSDLSRLAIMTVRDGRAFGVWVVLAGQDISAEAVGSVRKQMNVICFRVKDKQVATNLDCKGAEKITVVGRAMTSRWGMVQTPHFNKQLLIDMGNATANGGSGRVSLPADEWKLLEAAYNNSDAPGTITLAMVEKILGISTRQAGYKLDEWRGKGWVVKGGVSNAHRLTPLAPKIEAVTSSDAR